MKSTRICGQGFQFPLCGLGGASRALALGGSSSTGFLELRGLASKIGQVPVPFDAIGSQSGVSES